MYDFDSDYKGEFEPPTGNGISRAVNCLLGLFLIVLALTLLWAIRTPAEGLMCPASGRLIDGHVQLVYVEHRSASQIMGLPPDVCKG